MHLNIRVDGYILQKKKKLNGESQSLRIYKEFCTKMPTPLILLFGTVHIYNSTISNLR